MAKVPNGILQGIHGKLGQFVFRRINGKTFMCKSPVRRKRKPTERELMVRQKFTFMLNFLRPLKFLIRRTYKQAAVNKPPFSQAFSDNYHEIIMGDYPHYQINYPRVVLSRGNILLPEVILSASLLPGTISFIWSFDNIFCQKAKVFVATYCEELNSWKFDVDKAMMSDCIYTMEVQSFNGKPVHTYIGFISADGQKVSDGRYTGMVNIL